MSAGQEGTRFAGRRVVQNPDFRITVSMDEYVNSKLPPIEVPKGYLSNTKETSDGMLTNIKGVNGGLGWLASTARPSQCSSETMSRSSHHHHDLAHSFRTAALDDIHRVRFRHRGATATPQGWLVCASLVAHTNSGESTTGGDLCSKFSSGGNYFDQSIVGINDLERF